LGYTCIDEAQIDIAFFASGKGARLPQTCLPEPCQAALSQPQLARLIGRAPNPVEWDEYYARYADTCRAETTAFGDAPGAGTGLVNTGDFWAPILAASNPISNGLLSRSGTTNRNTFGGSSSRGVSGPVFSSGGGSSTTSSGTSTVASVSTPSSGSSVSNGSGTSGSGGSSTSSSGGGSVPGGGGGPNDEPRGLIPGFDTPPGGGGISNDGGGSGGGGGGNDDSSWTDEPNLPAVPVPAGVWMVLTGLAAFGGLRYRKTRATA
jgi:hypothetical protein